jgi:hypothetical protein
MRVIKSRRMRWGKCSSHGRNEEMHTKFLSVYLKGRDHLEKLEVNRRTVLKWILNKLGFRMWIRLMWSR